MSTPVHKQGMVVEKSKKVLKMDYETTGACCYFLILDSAVFLTLKKMSRAPFLTGGGAGKGLPCFQMCTVLHFSDLGDAFDFWFIAAQ